MKGTRAAPATPARAHLAKAYSRARPDGTLSRRSIWLLFGIALLIRLVHVLAMRASPYFTNPVIDAATYDDAARAIAAGQGHPDLIFWQPPGYSYFLALVYAVAGPGYLAPRIAQALLGASSAVLTAWIGARLFGRRVGLAAGYVVAIYGMLVYYDGELLTPTLTIALQLLAIRLALMAREHPARERWLWAGSGLAIGLASIVTAPSLVIAAVLAVHARRRAGLLLLGTALAIAPVTARNWSRGGELIPISWNAGINLYIGNNPRYDETVGIRPDLQWKRLALEPQRAGISRVGPASSYFVRKALGWAVSDPIGFARLQGKKLHLLLEGNEIPRNQEIYPARSYSPVLRLLLWKIPSLAVPFGLLLPLGVVGLVVAGKRAPLLLAIVLTYAAAILAFFITARYRVPLVPPFAIFGAEGVRWWIQDDRLPARVASLALAVALFLVANLGQGPMPSEMNADAEYSLGARLLREGRPDEAVDRFRTALRKNPRYVEAWVNLGVVQATRGERAEAERSLETALRIDPEVTIALTNLAVLREKAGDNAGALDLYERALRIDPSDLAARRKVAELRAQPRPAPPQPQAAPPTPLQAPQPRRGKP